MRKTLLRIFLVTVSSALLFSACSGENGIVNNVGNVGLESSDSESDDITVTPIEISEEDKIPEAENGVLYFKKSGASGSKSERKSSSSVQAPFIIVDYSSSSELFAQSSSSLVSGSSSSISEPDPESSSGIIINVWDWSIPIDGYLNPDIDYNWVLDKRDGQKYRIVKIANRWWFAQNLNYNGENIESWCYGDEDQHCDVTGRLYTWDVARDVCPEGWRLPYPAEWSVLITYSGGSQNAGRNLKSTVGWFSGLYDKDGNGTDSLGFSALPAGWRTREGVYDELGKNAYFWKNSGDTYGSYVSMYYADRIDDSYHYKNMGFSVRCIEELAE